MPSDPAQPETYPDLLEELASKITTLLAERGIDAAVAADTGRHCADRLWREWGGLILRRGFAWHTADVRQPYALPGLDETVRPELW